jgi:hypothetical protein
LLEASARRWREKHSIRFSFILTKNEKAKGTRISSKGRRKKD